MDRFAQWTGANSAKKQQCSADLLRMKREID